MPTEVMPDMIFIGLLTHSQKQAGYFVTQDEDFIYLWHGRNTDKPVCIKIFLYDTATVKEIREAAQYDHVGENGLKRKEKTHK